MSSAKQFGPVSLSTILCGLLSLGALASCLTTGGLAQTTDNLAPVDAIAKTETLSNHTNSAEAVRIVLSLSDRQVSLYKGETALSRYPVAVGAAETPTPQGQFEVSKLVIEPIWQSPWTGEMHPPGPDSALGLRWIGFFTDESGAFGFHGTPTLDSIGKAVSNGCVRMRNEDIVALFSQVSIGTLVIVEP